MTTALASGIGTVALSGALVQTARGAFGAPGTTRVQAKKNKEVAAERLEKASPRKLRILLALHHETIRTSRSARERTNAKAWIRLIEAEFRSRKRGTGMPRQRLRTSIGRR